jgi:hypothetical protein
MEYKPLSRLFPQITYQISCPYTPQQNGLSERMHRHIIKLSLATITRASLPLKYWDDIFASIVYLINRLFFFNQQYTFSKVFLILHLITPF